MRRSCGFRAKRVSSLRRRLPKFGPCAEARGGAFAVLNCELARFTKCRVQRAAQRGHLFSEVDPFTKKWCSSPYTQGPPPLFPPLLPPSCAASDWWQTPPSSGIVSSSISTLLLPSLQHVLHHAAQSPTTECPMP
jgi:hypothetical protein